MGKTLQIMIKKCKLRDGRDGIKESSGLFSGDQKIMSEGKTILVGKLLYEDGWSYYEI